MPTSPYRLLLGKTHRRVSIASRPSSRGSAVPAKPAPVVPNPALAVPNLVHHHHHHNEHPVLPSCLAKVPLANPCGLKPGVLEHKENVEAAVHVPRRQSVKAGDYASNQRVRLIGCLCLTKIQARPAWV